MNEYQLVEKLGMATSQELQEILDKSLRNIIKQLNSFQIRGEIKVLIFKTNFGRSRGSHRTKVYMTNELFNNICEIA